MAALFRGPFIAGFEASTMRRRDGRRNDLVAATRHDVLAAADYRRLLRLGITTAREGTAWHRIEAIPGRFDWSSVIDRIRWAERLGLQVIWDLCHFGWPDDVDVFGAAFPERLARFAGAFARLLRAESDRVPWYVPINEPSFVAWAGGDVAYLNPFARGRGDELKRQLVRAAIGAAAAVRHVDPRARICHVDPVIHIEPDPVSLQSEAACRRHNEAQYAAWDMLGGRLEDELGGSDGELDVIGVNFYDRNQWIDGGPTLGPGDRGFRPLREMLAEVHERYRRPIVIAETGAEGEGGAAWLRYVCDEVLAARDAGADVEAICVYPVVDYPGWDDDRHVPVGLWGYANADGSRPANAALIDELTRQARRLEAGAVGVTPALPGVPRATFSGGRGSPAPHGAARRRSAPQSRGEATVVLATDSRAPSGMGRLMLTLGRGLAVSRPVIVAAPDAADGRWLLSEAEDEGLEAWPLTDGSPAAQAESLRDALLRTRVGLVNVHAGIGWEGHALAGAARSAGVGCVVRTEHLPYLLTKPRDAERYRAGLRAIDGIIAVSRGVAASHVAAGVRPDTVDVVANGIDDPTRPRAVQPGLPQRPVRAAAGIPADAPLLVSVGRLTAQKGYDVLIAAMAQVARRRPDVHLVIAGSGPLDREIRAVIEQTSLGGAIHLIRHVADIPGLLDDAFALVLASRFEGLPLVALEAMAMGRPVVGTWVCGIDEAVVDGVTGRLVPPEDPVALAAGITELLEDPEAAERFGLAGRCRFEDAFRAERMVDETIGVYRRYLAAAPRLRRSTSAPVVTTAGAAAGEPSATPARQPAVEAPVLSRSQ